MILYGKTMKTNLPIKTATIVNKDNSSDFHSRMESSFIELCKKLDIPVPIWLKKNTREIAQYKKTFFNKDQFIEEVYFDNFVLEIEV